jgi:hypothetical protein
MKLESNLSIPDTDQYENYLADLCNKRELYIYKLRSLSRLLFTYLNKIIEEYSFADKYQKADVLVNVDGKEHKTRGKILDGYFIEKGDFAAIEEILYHIQKETFELSLE